MRKIHAARVLVASLALGASVEAARAETVELRNGGVLAGTVRLEGKDAVVVEARYPEVKSATLRREELTPESLYRVLERRIDARNPDAHRELGALAEGLGLHGAAIAEYRTAADLDGTIAKAMEEAVGRVTEELAAALVRDAQEELDQGRPQAALRYLHEVTERYGKTKAAADARQVMAAAHAAAGKAATAAPATAPAEEVPALLDEVTRLLGRADAVFQPLQGHGGSSVADQRTAERAVRLYEAAWERAKELPLAPGAGEAAEKIESVRARARKGLVDAYLTAGTILLQRRALPGAEEYCNRACELDPENRTNHELHRLILEARALYYGTVGGRGRGR